jgi:hypothetical protein
MAICKACGKKYSKWTTPVSARGTCRECFELELKAESEVKPQEYGSPSENRSREKPNEAPTWTPSIAIVGCGAIVVGPLLLLLFVSFIASLVHSPLYTIFSAADRWATLVANLVVVFATFPMFRLTKDRAFLFLAVGALSFAYGALWSLLVGMKPPVVAPMKWSQAGVQLYYAMRHVVDIIGLASYTSGVVLVARHWRPRSADKA